MLSKLRTCPRACPYGHDDGSSRAGGRNASKAVVLTKIDFTHVVALFKQIQSFSRVETIQKEVVERKRDPDY
jgi:hypothetical protein